MIYKMNGVFMHTLKSYSTNSRGVAKLITNNSDVKVHDKIPDPNGFFILDACIESNGITLICICGSNVDLPTFQYSQTAE